MPVVDVPGLGQVEFPDGMSNEAMASAIDRSMKVKAGAMALEGTNALQRGLIGAGKAVSDFGSGLGQMKDQALDFISPRERNLSSLVTGKMASRYDESKAAEAESRLRDKALMDTTAGKVGNFAGNVGIALPSMFVPGANTYTGAAIAGGLLGAAQPLAGDESRLLHAGGGAAAGLIGQGVGNAIGRVLRPVQSTLPAEEARLAQEAMRRGIPLTAADQTGSRPLKVAESVLENLPLTSGPQLAIKQGKQEAFNQAVSRTFGSSENAITPDVAGAARDRLGQVFTDLSSRNAANIDNAVLQKMGSVVDDANKFATEDVSKVVKNYASEILSKVDASGQIPGQAYRQLDSAMGRTIRGTSNGDIRNQVGQLRGVLRDAMDASINPSDQAAWREARRQYANLMTVAPLAARSETGNISGRTLLSAANTANQNAKFGGPSELAELGRIGRAFVADQIPNSGTAQRLAVQGLLTGGGALTGGAISMAHGNNPLEGAAAGAGIAAGTIVSPRVLQALMNSPAGQAYLARGLIALSPAQQAMLGAAGRGTAAGLLGQAVQQ